MASQPVAHIEKLGLVDSGLTDRKTGRKIVVPHQTKTIHDGRRIVKVVQSTQTIPTTLCNGTAETRFVFDGSAVDSCKQLLVRLQVSVSGSTSRLLPTPYWFSRIELHYRGSGSTLIQRWYPETLLLAMAARPPSDLQALAKSIGVNGKTFWAGEPHGVGVSKYYHIWLPMFYETGLHLDGKLDLGGTQLELRFYGNGGIVASGGGTVSADVVDLLIESDIATEMDKKAHIDVVRKYVQGAVFTDPVQLVQSGQTLNAGLNYEFSLEQYSGKCAALVVCIGSNIATTGQAASYACMNYLSLDGNGSGAGKLDLIAASGEQLSSGGTPFESALHRSWLGTKWFNQQFLQNYGIYVMSFARDLTATMFHGVIDDYWPADGSQYRLRISTPTASTSEVQTITSSASASGGSGTFKLGWSDPVSGLTSWTADLAFNASAATMNTALAALESVIQSKIIITMAGTFATGTSVTATVTDFAGAGVDLKGNTILCLSQMNTSAPAAISISSIARTTPGNPGWVNGSYTVQVFGLMIKRVGKSGGGYIDVQQI